MNELLPSAIRTRQRHARGRMNLHRLVAVLSGFALLLSVSACASTGIFSLSDDVVLGKLMVERLSWMDEVACVKAARSLPISDPAREAQLLDAMAVLATESGLPAGPVKKFFSGQMTAAKVRQEEYLGETALSKQEPQPVPDLAKTIRPALDLIGKKMVRALGRARDSRESAQVMAAARSRLVKAGYSEAVIAPAMRGLEAGLIDE